MNRASDWILIANATQARLLRCQRGSPMALVKSFEHAQSRSKVSQMVPDKMGREQTDTSFGGTSFQPRVNAKKKEHQRFARELAEYLEQRARLGGLGSLSIFASSSFLGELRAQLGAATARQLGQSHDLDLTHLALGELEKRIKREWAR